MKRVSVGAAIKDEDLGQMLVGELLDLNPEIRRYLMALVPDIWCTRGETLGAVATKKRFVLPELVSAIQRRLTPLEHRRWVDSLATETAL